MIRSTISSGAVLTGGRIASMALGIVLTPMFLRYLGLELCGLYGLMAGIFSYFALLDFGTGASGIRFLTAGRQGGQEEARRLYGTLSTISLCVGMVGILFAWLIMPLLVPFFAIPAELAGLAKWTVTMSACTFLLMLFKQQVYALLNSAGHFSGPALTDFGATLINAICMFVLLPRYPRLETLAYGFLGLAMLQILMAIAYGLFNGFSLRDVVFVCWDHKQFQKVFSFSRNVWLNNLSGIIVFESQKMFLGVMVGLESVTSYFVAGRFTSVQRAIGTGFFGPLTRHATDAFAKGEIEEFRRQYRRSTGLFSWVQVSVFVILFCFADRALHAWLGSETPEGATLLLRLQAAGMFCTLICLVMNAFARAAGITKPELIGAAFSIPVALILNFVLIRNFGVAGAAWANLLALSIGSIVYCLAMLGASTALRGTGVIGELARLVLPALALGTLSTLLNSLVPSFSDRWQSVFWLGVAASPAVLFSAVVFFWLSKRKK